MSTQDLGTLLKIVLLVAGLSVFFKTQWGNKIGAFCPLPFWVYFLSILASTFKFLPQNSPLYPLFSSLVLSGAIFLMLAGSPLKNLFDMGPKAMMAMVLASASIFLAAILSFVFMRTWLPAEAPAAVGALLGTWVGGSANMIAVKEILSLPDETLGALVLVDTILSYSWMALLFLGIRYQKRFDENIPVEDLKQNSVLLIDENLSPAEKGPGKWLRYMGLGLFGLVVGRVMVAIGTQLKEFAPFLSATAWTLLASTIVATLAAMTKLQNVGKKGSSVVGSFLLYCVLVTIGAKSSLQFTASLQQFFILGVLIFMIHGLLLFFIGRALKVPLALLATASQANIGGMVSAPVLAEAYKKGTAHFGVLMAILGTVVGTYVGVLGGGLCHWLGAFFSRGG